MSVIYNKYLELKSNNKDKLYLFKSGNFYIFVGDDCDTINNYVVLKKVKFSNESNKCGFPVSVLDEYLRVFKNHNLDVEVIEEIHEKDIDVDKLKRKLSKIDLNTITPIEALNILKEVKES